MPGTVLLGLWCRIDTGEKVEELSDLAVGLSRVPHGNLPVDRVAEAAPVPLALDVPGFGQVSDDAPGRSFRDSDDLRDVSESNVGVASDAEKHLCVVRAEVPRLSAALIGLDIEDMNFLYSKSLFSCLDI